MNTDINSNTPLSEEERELLSQVGYQKDDESCGTSVIVDHKVKYSMSNDKDHLEILPLKEALEKYDWVQDLMFKLIDPEENEHIKQAFETIDEPLGHFIWVKEGADVKLPIQKFSLIETPQSRQFTHDITVIDKGAKVELISGSSVPNKVHAGHHISVSETYIREGAFYKSTSIEHWAPNMEVYSYERTQMDMDAHSVSKSIMVNPIKHHYSQSKEYIGKNASNKEETIISAQPGTHYEMESETYLQGEDSQSEQLTRMVSAGGDIINRNLLIGDAKNCKGFVGCDGIKLSSEGEILSIPALLAKDPNAQLSHEASISMISAEKISYLMATGVSEDTARSLLIQGFLNLKEKNIPVSVRDSIEKVVEMAKSGGM
ncbi:MAG: hypothetical protein CSA86_03660 [Arcobacter sp.]|nr:MAG: hypothetical protein CSA86_03660 [Arcobacter sp.]